MYDSPAGLVPALAPSSHRRVRSGHCVLVLRVLSNTSRISRCSGWGSPGAAGHGWKCDSTTWQGDHSDCTGAPGAWAGIPRRGPTST